MRRKPGEHKKKERGRGARGNKPNEVSPASNPVGVEVAPFDVGPSVVWVLLSEGLSADRVRVYGAGVKMKE